jgi:hypothetical protein
VLPLIENGVPQRLPRAAPETAIRLCIDSRVDDRPVRRSDTQVTPAAFVDLLPIILTDCSKPVAKPLALEETMNWLDASDWSMCVHHRARVVAL